MKPVDPPPFADSGTGSSLRMPIHCPDRLDERRWVTDEAHGEYLHSLIDEARAAAARWLVAVTEALRVARISPVHFPTATGASWRATGRIIDPSLMYLVIAQARRADEPTNALYLGLVTQTPQSLWRGLTGFYLPYCETCDPKPETTLGLVTGWLPDDAQVLLPHRLPSPLQPKPHWFQRRMLLGVHLASTVQIDSSPWSLWYPGAADPPAGPALACIGPPTPQLHEVLYLDDARQDLRSLCQRLPTWKPGVAPRQVISYRCGKAEALQRLVGGIRSTPPETMASRGITSAAFRATGPIDWGGYVQRCAGRVEGIGITPDLRHAVRTMRAASRDDGLDRTLTMHYWPDQVGGVAFRDLLDLDRWMRQQAAPIGSSTEN